MTDAFSGTLHLRLSASARHRYLVLIVHAAAAGVVLALALHRPWLACLLLPVAMAAGVSWRSAMLRGETRIVRLHWHGNDTWSWQTRDGRWYSGVRTQAYVFATVLVIVTLRAHHARWRKTRVIVFRDSIDGDSHRRLRARLTVAPSPNEPAVDG